MAECFVAKASELGDGDRRIVLAGTTEIGVFCNNGAYFGCSNVCVHSGGPACEGLMINRVVDVIAPDWDFDLPSVIYDLPFLSETARRNILGGNAARVFGLDGAPRKRIPA